MSQMTRRDIMRGAGVAGVAGVTGLRATVGRAQTAEYTFKVGTDIPEAAPLNVYLRQAADAIRRDTNGRVALEIYSNNQLGGDPAMFSQLRSGAIECFLVSGINVLSALLPKASIYGLGFVFKDDKTVYDALDGELGRALRAQITGAGFAVTDRIWANGFRQVTSSNNPIRSAKDLDGFKIRVPVSNMWVSTFKSLGASPTSLPFTDVYSALQIGATRRIVALHRTAILRGPIIVAFHLTSGGMLAGHPGTIEGLDSHLAFLPPDDEYRWAVMNLHGSMLPLAEMIIRRGGHIQLGIGDYHYEERGAPTNAQLVREVVRLAEECEREIATPAEARRILGLMPSP